ncbi:MAG: class I SAM-dependent methyltransferase [Candidatus Krumholzibacteria bacterium]|nr:class I SAM-dependent methyltransferase [Candidatus Krumholzibacteria bacterium]
MQRYLEMEIEYVIGRLQRRDRVLELGCGYGRVALRLAEVAESVAGIDMAAESLALARRLDADGRCEFREMDALSMTYRDDQFDVVVCIQNGICAFGQDPIALFREALRVTRPSGRVLFSTYTDHFWPDRLAWFEAQAAAGLMGPVDRRRSGDGVIVCEDGFRSGRATPEDFHAICAALGVSGTIVEVDQSSLFCEVVKGEVAA